MLANLSPNSSDEIQQEGFVDAVDKALARLNPNLQESAIALTSRLVNAVRRVAEA